MYLLGTGTGATLLNILGSRSVSKAVGYYKKLVTMVKL